ncbi:hypothetical protein J7K93_14445, partial [bacterium]|nr:hypothetical protein [bacterium]
FDEDFRSLMLPLSLTLNHEPVNGYESLFITTARLSTVQTAQAGADRQRTGRLDLERKSS